MPDASQEEFVAAWQKVCSTVMRWRSPHYRARPEDAVSSPLEARPAVV
jgi:hypothetical protein